MDQIPINFGDTDYDPLFPLGFGIDTFALPALEDLPKILSAATSISGDCIELTFDKAMAVPENSLLGIDINDMSASVNQIGLKSDDPNTLLVYIEPQAEQSDDVNISSPGGIEAVDGSIAENFSYDVYNAVMDFHAIPGKIEAEDYFTMSGIQTETCSDAGGGLNVGYIEAGDYMDYLVEVNESGQYEIRYRVASLSNGGQITLQLEDEGNFVNLHTITFEATSGWQNWITVQDLVDLEAGKYTLRLLAADEGFNVNWISFAVPNDIILTHGKDQYSIQVFPNPVESGYLNLRSMKKDIIRFSLYSASGGLIDNGTFIETSSIDVSNLSPGLYIIRFENNDFIQQQKVIVR